MNFRKPQPVRLVIADSHPVFRDGLRRLLEAEPGLKVIGEASDGVEAVRLARELKPDILSMELSMPKQDGLGALRELSSPANALPVRVILLTAAIAKSQLVEALQLGGRGVVLKDSATQLLFKAIQTVMAGEYWVGRERVSNLAVYLRGLLQSTHDEFRQKNFGLTPRELEVVAAVVAGYSNKEIADYFKIAEDTVKRHLSNMFDKLGVSKRLELALFAINQALPLISIEGPPPPPTHSLQRPAWTMKDPLREDHDRKDPLTGNLLALLLSVCMLAIYAAIGYGAFLVLRAPLHLFARFLLRLTS